MKKIIFILSFIAFSTTAQAQFFKKILDKANDEPKQDQTSETIKPKNSIEQARTYLASDPCNSTGLGWAKTAIKKGIEKEEAEKMIDNCNSIQRKEAIETLKEDPDNYSATKTLEKLLRDIPNDEELNYLIAKSYLEASPSHVVEKHISKSIEANPSNIEYRWIRVRCNTKSNSNLDDYEISAKDLKYMLSKGAKSAKVYAYLSTVEKEIANNWFYKNVSKNNGWTDAKSKQNKEKQQNEKEALKHYRLALEAGNKALAMDKGYKNSINLPEIESKISSLK